MYTQPMVNPAQIELAQQRFFVKVYGWMFVALLTTAIVAGYIISQSDILRQVSASQGLYLVLIFAQLGLVLALSWGLQKMSSTVATALFFVYAAFTGVTFSVILGMYTLASVGTAFLAAAGTFGGACVYGYVTKKDLTSVGSFLIMGVWGLILASVLNFFFRSNAISMAVTYLSVLIFTGLSAYDAQKIKQMGPAMTGVDEETERKGAIIGALALYLDFINIFLAMLRIFGSRR